MFEIDPRGSFEPELPISLIAIKIFAIGAAAFGLILMGMVLTT